MLADPFFRCKLQPLPSYFIKNVSNFSFTLKLERIGRKVEDFHSSKIRQAKRDGIKERDSRELASEVYR